MSVFVAVWLQNAVHTGVLVAISDHAACDALKQVNKNMSDDLFALKPSQKSPEFGDMVHFLSHVSPCYHEIAEPFSGCLVGLLDKHSVILHPQLRMQLLQALMHMRHRNVLEAEPLLELCFRLFSCHDKMLKATLHSYIIQDIKLANARSRNERLNKSMQNYLYRIIEGDGEAAVKRALAVCTDLWRRQIWRDARTVNVIASATFHDSPSVMLAALKFFLGQDLAAEEDDDQADGEENIPAGPSKDDVYRAYHKGTPTTKKKKIRKLKRVMRVVQKSKRRGQAAESESFAAMQLLHDPQSFAERLLARCQSRGVRFEARLALMQVVSRAIGSHELIIENFYPFVQRYLKPSQREVVAILAAAVQAGHRLVPPDLLRPVLSQVVDQFVHDKARPEVCRRQLAFQVMTVGLKTVRELCVRCPRVMDEDLLSDLVLYKKEKDKHVKNAAKALVGLFRELKPSMLVKKERGRAADLGKELTEYGAADVKLRVDGVELLEDAIRRGKTGSSDDEDSDEDVDTDGEADATFAGESSDVGATDDGSPDEVDGTGLEAVLEEDEADESDSDKEDTRLQASAPDGLQIHQVQDDEEEEEGSSSASERSGEEVGGCDAGHNDSDSAHGERGRGGRQMQGHSGEADSSKSKLKPCNGSLKQLKQQVAHAKATKRQGGSCGAGSGDQDGAEGHDEEVPLEQMRILTQEDFERIRKLKIRKMVNEALAQQGLKSASRRAKVKEELYEEMEEALEEQEARGGAADRRLNPHSLLGKRSGRADKAERMASVMAGREDRDVFGSAVGRKKHKTGGKSNVEQQKRKVLPLGAMKQQAANRKLRQKQKNNPKHHRGRASRGAWD